VKYLNRLHTHFGIIIYGIGHVILVIEYYVNKQVLRGNIVQKEACIENINKSTLSTDERLNSCAMKTEQ